VERRPCLLALALALFVGAGCGGDRGTELPGPVGEGNIPVGKVVDPDGGPVQVEAREWNGRRQSVYADPQGVVWMRPFANGPVSLRVTSLALGDAPIELRVVAGTHQRSIFYASVVSEESLNGLGESARIVGNFQNNVILRVGEKRPIEFKVLNARFGSVIPTYSVSGGTASLLGEAIVGEAPGQGYLTAQAGSLRQTFRFMVTE
jgi:hypothetical protein